MRPYSKFLAVTLLCGSLMTFGALTPMMAQASPKPQHATKAAQEVVYACPMHPGVISHKPGKCPQCGMTLQKKMKKRST